MLYGLKILPRQRSVSQSSLSSLTNHSVLAQPVFHVFFWFVSVFCCYCYLKVLGTPCWHLGWKESPSALAVSTISECTSLHSSTLLFNDTDESKPDCPKMGLLSGPFGCVLGIYNTDATHTIRTA